MAWVRIPGDSTRRYRNTETGETISRRQYDERYGRLAKQGIKSNEAQAKKNRAENELEQLARPARGRTKLDITEADQRQATLLMRRDLRLQKEQTERVQKKIKSAKKRATRKRAINDRLLITGHMSRRIEVEYSEDGIAEPIQEAQEGHNHIVAYGVGVNGVHDVTGADLTMWIDLDGLGAMRDIAMSFDESDWETVEEQVAERTYFTPVSAFIHFAFDKNYAKKRKETYLRKKGKQGF